MPMPVMAVMAVMAVAVLVPVLGMAIPMTVRRSEGDRG